MDLCERRWIFFGRGWPNHAMSMAAFGFGNYFIGFGFGFGNSRTLDLLWVFNGWFFGWRRDSLLVRWGRWGTDRDEREMLKKLEHFATVIIYNHCRKKCILHDREIICRRWKRHHIIFSQHKSFKETVGDALSITN